MNDTTMDDVVALARGYARARNRLAGKTDGVREEQRAAVRRHMRWLRPLVAETSAAREALAAAIEAAPQLFDRPRTQSVDGVKFGLRKKPGRMAVADESAAIARLRKRLGAAAEGHIRVRESLVRDGLRELDARLLAAIGVSLTDAVDEVVVSAPRDDLDRLVESLMEDADRDDGP